MTGSVNPFKYKKLTFLIFIILIYYVWIATAGTNRFNLSMSTHGEYISYNHLADSFLAGKLNLLVEPKPELAKLEDPYEPGANLNYRWQDASYYKNKYYFYWGPVPALFFYVPYKLLTGYCLPDNLAVVIFMFGGFLFSAAFLLRVKEKQFPDTSEWMLLLLVSVLGFSNLGGFMVRQAGVYQVAISSGYFFLMASIYFIYRAISSTEISLRSLFIGGLCLGLANGSRASLCFASLVIIYLSIKELGKISNRPMLKDPAVLSLLKPYGICVVVIGVYNYLRFDNPLEFGHRYQTGEINLYKLSVLAIENLYPNLYFNLFHPPFFSCVFPYFHFSSVSPDFPHIDSYITEKIAGILAATPFVSLIVVCNFYRVLKEFYFRLVFFSGCINLMLVMLIRGATMRYEVDYATLFILASCFTLLAFDGELKKTIRMLSFVLGIYSICVGSALGFTGADDMIQHENPATYNAVVDFFKPLSDYLYKIKFCKN